MLRPPHRTLTVVIHDVIIIGQGLAGTALAWALMERSAQVAVVQAPDGQSASQVAAGLVTPVMGRKLRVAPDFHRDLAIAASAYRAAEKTLGASLWLEKPALRLIQTPLAAQTLDARDAELAGALVNALPPPANGFTHYIKALMMPDAARLDVAQYVNASRAHFETLGCQIAGRVAPGDLTVDGQGVTVAGPDLRARHAVWCGGQDDMDNAWLADERLSPAKGEILTVHIADFAETRTTHSGGNWLLPTSRPGVYRFGATYDHDDLTPDTTSGARETLCRKLGQMIERPFTVLEQQAGIRPVGPDRQPFIKRHPVHRRVYAFNGLGSRGVLWAPRLADRLADHLLRNESAAL